MYHVHCHLISLPVYVCVYRNVKALDFSAKAQALVIPPSWLLNMNKSDDGGNKLL